MKRRAPRRATNPNRNLTKAAALDRLLAMMGRWWEGWSLARIGREHGISRQRAGAILATVGCTRALWRMADYERPDSHRRGLRQGAQQARVALLHPLALRLTIRQRASLAWQALGLALPDIARRMRATSQSVRGLQAAAHWRLERLSNREIPNETIDIGLIGWADVTREAPWHRLAHAKDHVQKDESKTVRSNASVAKASVEDS